MAEMTVASPPPINRREFLFYIWGASITLTLAGSAGAVLWYAYPRFRAGEFGGTFTVPTDAIPPADSGPKEFPSGRFWLVNTGGGVLAIYKVCTHLGCLYKWVPSRNRFECPCHGSKFQLDGTWIEGPAPRNLDRFVVDAVDSSGAVLAETKKGNANADPSAGGPLPIPEQATALKIDTGSRIKGKNHS